MPTLIMTSDVYKSEEFYYDTLDELWAGMERIKQKIKQLNDGIERQFSIEEDLY